MVEFREQKWSGVDWGPNQRRPLPTKSVKEDGRTTKDTRRTLKDCNESSVSKVEAIE